MYLLDANVLIEAKNRYYAFDIAPGFWAWMDYAHNTGLVGSIEAVKHELESGDDELTDWARGHQSFFQPSDPATVMQFRDLTEWANSVGYTPAALNLFTSDQADYLLVAHARAHNHTLVTHETPGTHSRRRIKIPDACKAMGVDCMDTFEMLRKAKAQFHYQ